MLGFRKAQQNEQTRLQSMDKLDLIQELKIVAVHVKRLQIDLERVQIQRKLIEDDNMTLMKEKVELEDEVDRLKLRLKRRRPPNDLRRRVINQYLFDREKITREQLNQCMRHNGRSLTQLDDDE
jgi:hypothetical protein